MKEAAQEPGGRELGRSMADHGAFEIDTSSGSVEWMNEFALRIIGCSLSQVSAMSVFDLSPERFHERIREEVAETAGKTRRFYIFPTKTMDGKVAWWYVFRTTTAGSRRWAYADHISATPQAGPEFSFMAMQMETVSSQADLEVRMDDLDQWVQEELKRVDGDVMGVQTQFSGLLQSLEKAESAALSAAAESIAARNASLATQSELKKYVTKDEMQRHFEKFDTFEEESSKASAEILRLIRTDMVQEERLAAYEEHVRRTTETAVKAIEAQVSKSGRGLSRKVTIPVFAITTLAMIIQFALHYWNIQIVR